MKPSGPTPTKSSVRASSRKAVSPYSSAVAQSSTRLFSSSISLFMARPLSSVSSSVSVPCVLSVLLIAQRLGGVDLRGPAGRQVSGQERGRVADDDHEQQRAPRHPVLQARHTLTDVVYERAREPEAQRHPHSDAEQGYEGRFDQEDQPHLTFLEAQSPHHPDLLAPLDHRACRYDPERSDADHEPKAHEASEQSEDDPPRRVVVLDDLRCELGLEPVSGEVFLQGLGRSRSVHDTTEVEVVSLGRDGPAG